MRPHPPPLSPHPAPPRATATVTMHQSHPPPLLPQAALPRAMAVTTGQRALPPHTSQPTPPLSARAQPPSPTAARLTLLRPRPPGLFSALTSHTCQSQSQSSLRTPQPSQLTPHRHPSPRPVLSRSPPTLPSTTSLVPVLLLLVSSAPLLTFCKFPRTACFVSNALGL